MADHEPLPDWLPADWTMEVKVRKNGKKDKCYTNPSNELKFYSKPDVLRYINNGEINHPRSEEKDKSTGKHSAIKYVVEKAVAEGLPPGWIKEMRVRKKGRSIRRDPYYIDPVSGYVFRSMKDVVRYLETGELGKLAFKPKDKGCISIGLGDDNSPAESEGQKIADSGTGGKVTGNQSSVLGVVVKGGEVLEFNCTRDSIPLFERTSDQGGEGTAMSSVNMPEANDLEQREGKGDSSINIFVSPSVVGALPEKLPSENGVEKHGNRKIQRRTKKLIDKKGPDLPRRASKRLAGVETDSLLELVTNNQARQVACKRSGGAETNTAGKVKMENMEDEKQGCPVVLPLGNVSIPEAPAGQVETDNKGNEKPGLPLDSTLRDSWMDPCIDFAIKTLTGAIPVEDENKVDRNPGSSLDFHFGDSWTDPCIEFAVKTLKGEIPVGDDLSIQDYFQQAVSSSETQGTNSLMSPNVGLDNFCRTNFSSQHFDSSEKPLYTQQALVAPILPPHSSSVGFQNSGNTGLHQQVEGRSEECPRPTIL